MVRLDRFWQLKVIWPDQKWSGVMNSVLMSPQYVLWSFYVSCVLPLVASCVAICSYELAYTQPNSYTRRYGGSILLN